MAREQLLARTFVELADTLVADFDAIDLLHTLSERSVTLLEADAASIILGDQRGNLQVVASTTPEAHTLDIFQVQTSEGPCLDCYRTGHPMINIDLSEVAERWPSFRKATADAGYRSTHSLPMRLRDTVIGALNLFCTARSVLDDNDVSIGQALADVATIGLLQERVSRQRELLSEQLQTALNSRVLIEQAKGALSERATIGIDKAFQLMREHSRRTRRPLTDIARSVIDGSLAVTDLTTP
jgi:transcriptional regulator with GAF, ATPase, and Fis domain